MINFDSLSLKALTEELSPILASGRIHKVQQPSKRELLLTIRAFGKNHKLYICVDPKYPHVALLSKDGEEFRRMEKPQFPPMFCMLLRKHMEGCKINAMRQPEFERIFEICFDSCSELGTKVPMVLSCEFMGKYSNIILYNYETNMILGCAHTVSSEKSREREVAGGLPFVYPPKQEKLDINKISEEEFFDLLKVIPTPVNVWLNEKFGYMSRAVATEICHVCKIKTEKDTVTAVSPEKAEYLYRLTKETVNLENKNPCLSEDMKFYSPIGLDKSVKWRSANTTNSMIDEYFGRQVFEDKFSRQKNSLFDAVKKEFKKKKKLFAKHEKTFQSENKQDKYRQFGDLIMTNLYRIKLGMSCVELENIYEDNKPVEIELDAMKFPSDNAQRYYKLYNKAKTASQYSEKLMNGIQGELDYLESIKESVNIAETIDDLTQIRQELIEQDIIKRKEAKQSKKEQIIPAVFTSSDGFTILAGKNNRQNEYILKTSSPEDIWLHVQDIPGSHVVIKRVENEEIPKTTLHEAVYIAAWYSSGRESSNIPVIYTRRKFVKKPSGSKPGYVIFTREKTLWVNPEKEKVMALRKQGGF